MLSPIFKFFDRAAAAPAQHMPLLQKTADSYNVYEVAKWRAAVQSARYFEKKLLTALQFGHRDELLAHAMQLAPKTGLFLEFGVAGGESIRQIAAFHAGPVYGFDSFEGLPEDWFAYLRKGFFAQELPRTPDNVTLVKGWFSDTLDGFLAQHDEPVAFLHIDSDLYSSADFVLRRLEPRLAPGAVVLFDEYWNYPGWLQHEFKAFREFIERTGLGYRYEGFVPTAHQVCVVLEERAA
ncbi:MAG: class I SAM-dependent methyltransferase [Beijerinckiaceae bacterium]|nr:class I SAM-dependent methyltransferase [Beijerinckiaceae bacterium]